MWETIFVGGAPMKILSEEKTLELQRKAEKKQRINTAYMAGKLAANRGESAPRVEYQDADLLRAWRRGHRDAKSIVR